MTLRFDVSELHYRESYREVGYAPVVRSVLGLADTIQRRRRRMAGAAPVCPGGTGSAG